MKEPDQTPTLAERLFPIMGAPSIPWAVIAPCEAQAQCNHGQTLERLAERQGLSPCEAVAVLEGRDWRPMGETDSRARLEEIVKDRHYLPAIDRLTAALSAAEEKLRPGSPTERAPTQWAYEQVCKALERERGQGWQIRAEAAEAERDSLREQLAQAQVERDNANQAMNHALAEGAAIAVVHAIDYHADVLSRLRDKISTRLNDHLCEMKEGYDDSIVGFNEAWDIVRAAFDEEEGRDRQSPTMVAALEESVKLQSHYAALLNDYDGGKRMIFADAKAWVDRLAASSGERDAARKRVGEAAK